jgi:hypothetical protein
MKNALRWLKRALPFLRLGAVELSDLDENSTGTDDQVARWIEYIADVLEAIVRGQPIPLPVGLFSKEQIEELSAKAETPVS